MLLRRYSVRIQPTFRWHAPELFTARLEPNGYPGSIRVNNHRPVFDFGRPSSDFVAQGLTLGFAFQY